MGESVKKGKFGTKSFFGYWMKFEKVVKMASADIETDVKQEIKKLIEVFT